MARSLAEVAAGAAVLAVAAGFLAYASAHTGRGGASGYELSADFNRIDGLASGSDVRIAGVNVGKVIAASIDPKSYLAHVTLSVRDDIKLPDDSSAEVITDGLLGGKFLSLAPGGSEKMLKPGGRITITQSSVSLEDLLGKFIFNVGDLASAVQKTLPKEDGAKKDAAP
jgi:phospholipid/cholesterol/gamma-HCH transport system substrate-binding protein